MNIAVIVVLIVVMVIVVAAIVAYNGLVALRNRFKASFAQIDVALKRRYDLIPNLVETTKGYLKHERETLEAVTAARTQAYEASQRAAANPANAAAMRDLMQADSQMTSMLGRLFAVAEAYPDLKASQNMMQLMTELSSTEDKVASARQVYNEAVMQYNTARETFPSVIIANAFGFSAAQLFEIESMAERQAPKVSFTS
jgi:LemA protein